MPGQSSKASREERPRDGEGARGGAPPELRELKVALVHDWLTGMRGGEKCLEVFCDLFPRAHIYTLFHFPGTVSRTIESLPIHTSPLQKLPGLRRWYRYFLPLFPWAIGRFDLSGHDLIVSSSHCVAKGAGAGSGVPHVSYCFTPMRYIWDQAPIYFDSSRYSRWKLFAIERMLRRLRRWDQATHPTEYISISRFVAERVRRIYGRESKVIYPPVDMSRFQIKGPPEDFYLIVSALTPYKRVDLAVRALGRLGRRLIVVGKGEEEARLRKMAGPGVSFLGWASDAEVADLFSRCRASLLPGEEDFGIAPLEAMASGRPVVALGRGGAVETVVDIRGRGATARGAAPCSWGAGACTGGPQTSTGSPEEPSPTGILFDEPTEDSLAAAILELERRRSEFQPEAIRRQAERFSLERFRSEISEALRRFVLEAASARAP